MIPEKTTAPRPVLLEGTAILLAIAMAALAVILATGCAAPKKRGKNVESGLGWWNLDLEKRGGVSGRNPSHPLKKDSKKNWKKEMDFLSVLIDDYVEQCQTRLLSQRLCQRRFSPAVIVTEDRMVINQR